MYLLPNLHAIPNYQIILLISSVNANKLLTPCKDGCG